MTSAANAIQHGGDHYRTATGIQHWDLMAKYRINYLEGNATKYVYRWRRKNGLEDLEKCLHYIQKTLELVLASNAGGDKYYQYAYIPESVLNGFYEANGVAPPERKIFSALVNWSTVGTLEDALYECQALIARARSWVEQTGQDVSALPDVD